MMKASIAIQVIPEAKDETQLCRIVDQVISYIKSTGLHHDVGPFETGIEGESYEELMDVAKECQLVAVAAGAPKVSSYIKVVYCPRGEILTIDQKLCKLRGGTI